MEKEEENQDQAKFENFRQFVKDLPQMVVTRLMVLAEVKTIAPQWLTDRINDLHDEVRFRKIAQI